jgi:very-short-patch-repair endonuclease
VLLSTAGHCYPAPTSERRPSSRSANGGRPRSGSWQRPQSRSNLPGRASLLALCDALADGCRSELELWGLRHVFRDDRRFAHGVRQLPVSLGSRVVYLDLAFLTERVAVELDGAGYHGTPEQRERDMRRDAALSALGWIVLRFSYRRLPADPEGVRNEVDAVLRIRRRQLPA